jgi:DNA-directed RNA polymerase specialized sigma subunit
MSKIRDFFKKIESEPDYIGSSYKEKFHALWLESYHENSISKQLLREFLSLSQKVVKKIVEINNEEDIQDLIASCFVELCKCWKKFDVNKGGNIIAYFVAVIKRTIIKNYVGS